MVHSTTTTLSCMQPQILIVTGYSGAGKSTVLRSLEDVGYFCVDNLPMVLFESFYKHITESGVHGQRVALGIDVRSGTTIDYLVAELQKNKETLGKQVSIFFLTSSSRVLVRRFQETRRRHPLATELPLADAIKKEKQLMKPLIAMADKVLDTDQLTIHQLRSFVRGSYTHEGTQKILVNFISFGFKYGVPAESNFVFDLRSLPNPYFIPSLKSLKGTDQAIVDYLFDQPEVEEYWGKLLDFVRYSIEKSEQEGRFFIKIAIGCTGGRHRSVAFVAKLAECLADKAQIMIDHRDIARDSYQKVVV